MDIGLSAPSRKASASDASAQLAKAIRYDSAERGAIRRLAERAAWAAARRRRTRGPSGYRSRCSRPCVCRVESQMLVFKTSLRRDGPKNPRAIWALTTRSRPAGSAAARLEFVGQDPTQGAVFYTMPRRAISPSSSAVTLPCHASEATHYVPKCSLAASSPAWTVTTMYGPAHTTDHRSPFELRWGGWLRDRDAPGNAPHGQCHRH